MIKMTYQSFDDKVNIKGLLRLMDSEKIDRGVYLEHKFINEAKLNQYDNAMKDVEAKLRELDDVIETQSESAKNSYQNSQNSQYSNHSDNSNRSNRSKQSNHSKQSKRSDQSNDNKSSKYSKKRSNNYISKEENTINLLQDDFVAKIQNGMYQQPVLVQQQNHGLSSQYEKGDLMEDVKELLSSLAREGVSSDEIPMIDLQCASVQDLREMKQLLMKKWKRKYSRSIVEDIIYVVVKGIESVMDGKTEILGFRPDLKGFGGTVMNSVKSHGLEISKIVEKNCERYGIGVGDKFMAKVIVSAIKNSAMNKFGNDGHQHQKNMESMYKARKK